MSQVLERYVKKVGIDKKTGREKEVEIRPNYIPIPLSKLSLICDVCGYELPVTKIKKYSPIFCPKGCGVALRGGITKTLSHIRWSDEADNLKIADKFIIKRVK